MKQEGDIPSLRVLTKSRSCRFLHPRRLHKSLIAADAMIAGRENGKLLTLIRFSRIAARGGLAGLYPAPGQDSFLCQSSKRLHPRRYSDGLDKSAAGEKVSPGASHLIFGMRML